MPEDFPYEDIVDLPHHSSPVHPRMSRMQRAAQFSPFAALTGYEDAIAESGRRTEGKIELAEDEGALLDERLRLLRGFSAEDAPEVRFTWFVPDRCKPGGAYVSATGRVLRMDSLERSILLDDGTLIPIDDLKSVEGAVFAPDADGLRGEAQE